MRRWGLVLAPVALAGGLLLMRWRFPERAVDVVGPRALVDSLFALGLLLLVLLIAVGAGRAELHLLRLKGLSSLEHVVFSAALGLGTVAAGITLLAFVGGLRPAWITGWLALMASLAGVDWIARPPVWTGFCREVRSWWQARLPGERLGILIAALLLLPALLMALSPPWDYDGLMYHLQAPRLFLEQGRLSLMPDLWQANGPLATEMLFAIGLGFGSDTFAKVLHLSFGVLLVLTTVAMGDRVLGRRRGTLAGLVLLGLPTLPFWASAAYADVAWAAFESLAILALIVWLESQQARALVLAGLLAGLALSTKYLGLILLPCTVVIVLAASWRQWAAMARDTARFLIPAVMLSAPWYLKNLILAGNPLYPLVFGGLEWPAERLALLNAYLQSFGMGHTALDFLLLPVRIYLYPTSFGTFARGNELPSYLFLLAPLYFFFRPTRSAHALSAIVVLRWILWAATSQQTRFLLPVFPAAAVLAGAVLSGLADRWAGRRILRQVPLAFVLTSLLGVLALTCAAVGVLDFHDVVLGRESKAHFLLRLVGGPAAVQYADYDLPQDARVLMMWDGRGYYCDERCIPDAEQSRWTWYSRLAQEDVSEVTRLLAAEGITHLMFGRGDAAFIGDHDPSGANREALEFFRDRYRPACTTLVYADSQTEMYEVTCLPAG